METRVFSEAMRVADRMAGACGQTAAASTGATRNWVVEIVGAADGIVYRAPVAQARAASIAASPPDGRSTPRAPS